VIEIRWDREDKPPFRNPRKTAWVKFSRYVRESLQDHPVGQLSRPDILERLTQTITDVLCKAFIKTCSISRPPKSNRNKWWTPELGQIRKETRKLYNRAKVRNCQVDWEAYYLNFENFKNKCRRAKTDSWAALCEDLTSTTEASRLRRLLANDPAKPGLLCDLNGNSAKDSQESPQLLINTHFPGSMNAVDTSAAITMSTSREMGRELDMESRDQVCFRFLPRPLRLTLATNTDSLIIDN